MWILKGIMGLLSKNVLISAAGNFSTAYNLQIISIAILIAGYVYPETKAANKASVAVAARGGALELLTHAPQH